MTSSSLFWCHVLSFNSFCLIVSRTTLLFGNGTSFKRKKKMKWNVQRDAEGVEFFAGLSHLLILHTTRLPDLKCIRNNCHRKPTYRLWLNDYSPSIHSIFIVHCAKIQNLFIWIWILTEKERRKKENNLYKMPSRASATCILANDFR